MKIRDFVIGLALAIVANLIAIYIYEKLKEKKK